MQWKGLYLLPAQLFNGFETALACLMKQNSQKKSLLSSAVITASIWYLHLQDLAHPIGQQMLEGQYLELQETLVQPILLEQPLKLLLIKQMI